MVNVSKNSGTVSRTFFVITVVVLLVVCVVTGFVGYQLKPLAVDSAFDPNYQSLQSSYSQLQLCYENLTFEYNQLNSQYQQLLLSTDSTTPTPTPDAKEDVAIQGVGFDSANKIVTIYAQSKGNLTPVVNSIIIKDAAGNTVTTVGIGIISPAVSGNALAPGTLYTIPSAKLTITLASGAYTATLVTYAGNSFISPTLEVSTGISSYLR
jgi:hypothetical protein